MALADRNLELGVAPMEGVTGFATRLWLAMASRPASMTTPFLRVTRAQPSGELPLLFVPELFALRGALPYAITPQYIATDPDSFLRAAEHLPPAVAAAVELNCGCPAPTALGKDAGSGILRDPEAFARSMERIAARLGAGRFAVKMRIGIENAAESETLADCVATLPLARLSVHGRTRKEGYRGESRWTVIEAFAAKAARAVTPTRAPTPTWGSGDVTCAETLRARLELAPGVAGVMVGRGALRNPWVFEELRRGAPLALTNEVILNALLCFALLNELSMQSPEKLIARVAAGRLGAYCGDDPEAWERAAASLTGLLGGAPFVLAPGREVPEIPVSQAAMARLRYLWSHLGGFLGASRPLRARAGTEFFAALSGGEAFGDFA